MSSFRCGFPNFFLPPPSSKHVQNLDEIWWFSMTFCFYFKTEKWVLPPSSFLKEHSLNRWTFLFSWLLLKLKWLVFTNCLTATDKLKIKCSSQRRKVDRGTKVTNYVRRVLSGCLNPKLHLNPRVKLPRLLK